MAKAFIAKSLNTLCEQNSARGAVFRTGGDALQLVASTAGLDQAFLDAAGLLWSVSRGGGRAPLTDGRLSLFELPEGVAVLDSIDEAACPPRLRSLLLEGIGHALAQLQGDADDARLSGEAVPSWLEAIAEKDLERHRLLARLRAADWCIAKVARREGMSRRGLYYKLDRLGIRRPKPA